MKQPLAAHATPRSAAATESLISDWRTDHTTRAVNATCTNGGNRWGDCLDHWRADHATCAVDTACGESWCDRRTDHTTSATNSSAYCCHCWSDCLDDWRTNHTTSAVNSGAHSCHCRCDCLDNWRCHHGWCHGLHDHRSWSLHDLLHDLNLRNRHLLNHLHRRELWNLPDDLLHNDLRHLLDDLLVLHLRHRYGPLDC